MTMTKHRRAGALALACVLAGIAIGLFPATPSSGQSGVPKKSSQEPKAEIEKPGEKKCSFTVDVVLEQFDKTANTLTARSTVHVIPPRGNVGGSVHNVGTNDSPAKDKTTKFVNLPVLPGDLLHETKLKPGAHALLRLELLTQGALVVVGIEEFTGVEKIGVDFLDAPGLKKK